MRTMKVLLDGAKIGVASVAHIEVAWVIHEGNFWKVKLHLASGLEVTSISYTRRDDAEVVLRHLFD